MTVYGYIFAPVDGEPEGAAEQQHKLAEYCRTIGLTIDMFVSEAGVSVRKPFDQRPAGSGLMDRLQGGDVVLVVQAAWILASAAAGERLLAALGKRAVSLHCVDLGENISMPGERKLVVSEGNSLLVRRLLSALAVCEGSSHGEAIRAVKRSRRSQGKYLGGPVPFGWQVDAEGFLVQHREQQLIIGEIRQLRGDGWSYRNIAARLKESHGMQLSHEGIRRILTADERRKTAEARRRA